MFKYGYIDKAYYRYFSVENPCANIFAIHGLGGHCVWFDNTAKLFNKQNINFFSFDLPAFGQSKYQRGSINSYNEWIDVSREVIEKFLLQFNVKEPVFVLGHSMGALIALLLSKKVKANGWILSVPGFGGNAKTWPFFDVVLPILTKAILKPEETVIMPFGPELITKNKDTQMKIKRDDLRVTNPTARLLKEVNFMAKSAIQTGKDFKEKFILLEAGEDLVCSNSAMDRFFESNSSEDKTKIIYESSYHDLFIEEDLEKIVSDLSLWINKRI